MTKKKVLLIDDEPYHLKYHIRWLRHEGFDVQATTAIEHALRLVKTERFDVVVVDLMMAPREEYKVTGNCAGLDTGMFLVGDLFGIDPALKVVVLTNMLDEKILMNLRSRHPRVPVFQKVQCGPPSFVLEVKKILQQRVDS